MKAILKHLFHGKTLERNDAKDAMSYIMSGSALPEEIGAFLGALAARGETAEELVGLILAMRERALPFPTQRKDLIDVCGTGGDDLGTFNISTSNALLLASLGLGVVKHGNRAVSSLSGSADVLEKLGIPIDEHPSVEIFEKQGFVFLFAPSFHPAMKHVGPVRRSLGLRTIFNMLGPLANPAPVKRQVIGVYSAKVLPIVAEALLHLGTEDALVVYGKDGLDEISLSGETLAIRVREGHLQHLTLSPEDFGLKRAPSSVLKGGTSEENAKILESLFQGEAGPRADVVSMNAAAALLIAGKVNAWRDGVQIAQEALRKGVAWDKLETLRKVKS